MTAPGPATIGLPQCGSSMKTIFEHAGIMLDVDYTPGADEDGGAIFNKIRVLGENYKPVGPDLIPLLMSSMIMTRGLPRPEASMFLAAIAGELP